METHPFAKLFPEMPKEQFVSLKADIKDHGQHIAVTIYEEKVLDGIHRQRACRELGIKLKTEIYKGDDPLGFVISQNIQRRHLDESQRAMVAARMGVLKNGKRVILPLESLNDIAKLCNIGNRTARHARVILEKGSGDLIRAVDSGEITVAAGVYMATMPPQIQVSIVHEKDKKKRKQKIKEAKQKAKERHKEEQSRTTKRETQLLHRGDLEETG